MTTARSCCGVQGKLYRSIVQVAQASMMCTAYIRPIQLAMRGQNLLFIALARCPNLTFPLQALHLGHPPSPFPQQLHIKYEGGFGGDDPPPGPPVPISQLRGDHQHTLAPLLPVSNKHHIRHQHPGRFALCRLHSCQLPVETRRKSYMWQALSKKSLGMLGHNVSKRA